MKPFPWHGDCCCGILGMYTGPNDPCRERKLLTVDQIETYQRDGVLIVESILSPDELKAANAGLHETLLHHGIDSNHLADTGHHLSRLSSTNGSGGVLDIYYEPWQVELFAANAKLFQATTELWEACYCRDPSNECSGEKHWMSHPYGPFDCRRGYMYLDRLGYRLPTQLAHDLGKQPFFGKGKKVLPIQRSLTPHLDCCPSDMFSESQKKWRPIQCFVALTDALETNQGGFEAARGFHRDFHTWAAQRPPSRSTTSKTVTAVPAPCVGEYTHIRPQEDAEVMKRIEHIPVPAGSAVFWDIRIPHANAYRHTGTVPRAVVYCSFLPDVAINRSYVARQLQDWKAGLYPSGDQWIQVVASPTDSSEAPDRNTLQNDHEGENDRRIEEILSTPLARRLAGWEPWDD